jgi:hypothetical protein
MRRITADKKPPGRRKSNVQRSLWPSTGSFEGRVKLSFSLSRGPHFADVRMQRRRVATLPRPKLLGGEGRGLRRGEHGAGVFGDRGAFEEARVLRALQARLIGEGESCGNRQR